jgi:membrane protein YdbS with pleckstrin-like domain
MDEPSQPVPIIEPSPDSGEAQSAEGNVAAESCVDGPSWLGDPRLKRLDPRQVTLERISGWVFVAVVSAVALALLSGVVAANWPPDWPVALLVAGVLIVLFALAWYAHEWPVIAYRRRRYLANEQGLEIYRGVLWRSIVNVPRSRIQHTDVRQGPLQRRLGLGTLVVHTAGTQHAAIELDGLSREEALALRDLVAAREDEDDAV